MCVCIVFRKLVNEIEHICNYACIARTEISSAFFGKTRRDAREIGYKTLTECEDMLTDLFLPADLCYLARCVVTLFAERRISVARSITLNIGLADLAQSGGRLYMKMSEEINIKLTVGEPHWSAWIRTQVIADAGRPETAFIIQ
jgi:hypothetical protein